MIYRFTGKQPSNSADAEDRAGLWESLRTGMLSLLRSRGIDDPDVLRAMAEVPRHAFIPRPLPRPEDAYGDHPLPIGFGQTISQPYIVAYITQLLRVKSGQRVLEIGSGCGYQAAVLASLGARVTGVECLAPLIEHARGVLEKLHYTSIRLVQGDGYAGGPDPTPYDRILLSCAPARIPESLLDQLAEGGRLIAPVGTAEQALMVVERRAGGLSQYRDLPVRFVPMVAAPGSNKSEP